jgi:hypothetical protein
MRKIAKWAGILWIAAVAAYADVIGPIETIEERALIFPAGVGLGEDCLLTLYAMPGYLLYCWAARVALNKVKERQDAQRTSSQTERA